MNKIIDTLIGNLDEKRDYRKNEARAKALPAEYREAYKQIKKYIFTTSGILSMEPLKVLVDILEEANINGKSVIEVTGPDVAAFADELVRDAKSYQDDHRKKLNDSIANKPRD